MANTSIHFAYYIFLLTFCIDEGDGRWKKKDKENLQRDIKLYKKITERVEHELQEYYAEYEDHRDIFNVNRNFYETNRHIPKVSGDSNDINGRGKKMEPFLSKQTEVINNVPNYNETISNSSVTNNEIGTVEVKTLNQRNKWPKFEDILLAIGKKYDWKNDRWIKVKEKFKIKDKDEGEDNRMYHEKHRFSYRTIKLNRGKNKRNVVIAVTAIR